MPETAPLVFDVLERLCRKRLSPADPAGQDHSPARRRPPCPGRRRVTRSDPPRASGPGPRPGRGPRPARGTPRASPSTGTPCRSKSTSPKRTSSPPSNRLANSSRSTGNARRPPRHSPRRQATNLWQRARTCTERSGRRSPTGRGCARSLQLAGGDMLRSVGANLKQSIPRQWSLNLLAEVGGRRTTEPRAKRAPEGDRLDQPRAGCRRRGASAARGRGVLSGGRSGRRRCGPAGLRRRRGRQAHDVEDVVGLAVPDDVVDDETAPAPWKLSCALTGCAGCSRLLRAITPSATAVASGTWWSSP